MIYFENYNKHNVDKYIFMYLTPAVLTKLFFLLSVLDMG